MTDEDFEALMYTHRPWIRWMAASIRQRGIPRALDYDDLVAVGVIGLWEATQRYDHRPTCTFKTYARHRVLSVMRDEVRRMGFDRRTKAEAHAQCVDLTDEFALDRVAFLRWQEESRDEPLERPKIVKTKAPRKSTAHIFGIVDCPGCGNAVVKITRSQRFDSKRCRNRIVMRERRAKEKERLCA